MNSTRLVRHGIIGTRVIRSAPTRCGSDFLYVYFVIHSDNTFPAYVTSFYAHFFWMCEYFSHFCVLNIHQTVFGRRGETLLHVFELNTLVDNETNGQNERLLTKLVKYFERAAKLCPVSEQHLG